MQATAEKIARWDERQALYCCQELEIWSEDGDEWHDDFGGQPDTEEFHAASIRFVGGPRDGEAVA